MRNTKLYDEENRLIAYPRNARLTVAVNKVTDGRGEPAAVVLEGIVKHGLNVQPDTRVKLTVPVAGLPQAMKWSAQWRAGGINKVVTLTSDSNGELATVSEGMS